MKNKKHGELSWVAEDVQTLRPEWTLDACEEWLGSNGKYLRDRLCELGWEVMGDLLGMGLCNEEKE